MPVFARKLGRALSPQAKEHLSGLQSYPSLDTWMNPLTRGIARHYANETWRKSHDEIDFKFRMYEETYAAVPCVHYETERSKRSNRFIFYVHGGGFVAGSPKVNATTVLPICELTGLEGVGVDYTLLPEGRFPVPVDEVDAVYKALKAKNPDSEIIIVGDSAGGTLVLANLLRWRDENTPMPHAAILLSPVVDGVGASDTYITIDGHDPLIRSNRGRLAKRLFEFYAPGQNLKNPMVSPIYGAFDGLPPLLVHVGSREVLLGDAARLAEAARLAGVDITLRVFDGMFHLFHMHWSLAEARTAHRDIADFIGAL
ncbi:MAG: alpha/beta hydrolase fold domain-containing protein [Pseudomonadota bacterium]